MLYSQQQLTVAILIIGNKNNNTNKVNEKLKEILEISF